MIVGVMACSAVGFYEKMGMSMVRNKRVKNRPFQGLEIPVMGKVLLCIEKEH